MITVLGFYDRHNLGDDAIAYVWNKFFENNFNNAKWIIKNTDDIQELDKNTSTIILGGGDVVNNYFLHKLNYLYQKLNLKNIPVYLIGVGITYPSSITDNTLNQFDYILTRTQDDINLLKQHIGTQYVNTMPDLTFLLPKYLPPKNNDTHIKYNIEIHNKNIGFFLARPIYNGDKYAYNNILESIVTLIQYINDTYLNNHNKCVTGCIKTIMKCNFYLFSMNTNINNKLECDYYINRDLIQKVKHLPNVHLVDKVIDINDIQTLFNHFHLTICTRFHAHIFSIMANVPILSIYNTRKVETLLNKIGINDYSIKYETNKDNKIMGLNTNELIKLYNKIENEREIYCDKLMNYRTQSYLDIINVEKIIKNLLYYRPIKINKNKNIYNEFDNFINDKYLLCQERLNKLNENQIWNNIDYKLNDCERIHKQMTQIISYTLTNKIVSNYSWGLEKHLNDPNYNLYESVKWILCDYYDLYNPIPKSLLYNTNVYRPINIDIKNELDDVRGIHRSGWEYVLNNIQTLHNPNGVLFNSYLDKTFGWECNFLSFIGKIPYTKKWIGVFHHPVNTGLSPNNIVNCFKQPVFKDSLQYCNGIIVLSNMLKEWIQIQFKTLGFKIPILNIKHPTVFCKLKFNINNYKSNNIKKVVQIGNWLRNTDAIYNLNVPFGYQKYILNGLRKTNIISNICMPICHQTHCENNSSNNIIIINHVDNSEYDKLLAESVVFLNLIDASACNTLIECIVRNTPILINPLPAVIEYLGIQYPLYYHSLQDATNKLNIYDISNANKYLSQLNKNDLHINNFMCKLINWLNSVC